MQQLVSPKVQRGAIVYSITIFMEHTAQKERATGKKGPATALEPGTYALSRSFSHVSHGDRSRSFFPYRSYMYVPVTGVLLSSDTNLKTCASRLVLCVM